MKQYRRRICWRPRGCLTSGIAGRLTWPVWACLAVVALWPASAWSGDGFKIPNRGINRAADGVLTLMAFTALPDVTTSSLSIDNAEENDPGLKQTTLGGGFTLSKSVPVYLEGTIGYSRFDPTYIATRGQERRDLPFRWNTFAATGGVGWDFPLIDSGELVLRPIFNFTLGHASSDLKLGERLLSAKLDRKIDLLDGGDMNAYGVGGAIMLDYERFHPDGDIDLEIRYTNIQIRTFNTDEALEGSPRSTRPESGDAGVRRPG